MNKDIKEQIKRINSKDDIQKLDLLYRQILNLKFNDENSVVIQDKITSEISEQINTLIKENKVTTEEYSDLIEANEEHIKWEKRKEKLAEDRLNMIWENCSSKEIAEILKNHYEYTDQEIIEEFVDEEVQEEIKEYLLELTEIEESSKNVILNNGYTFVFENEYYFSKLKRICEYSQEFVKIPDRKEFAIITNSDVSKEAFLVKYDNNIEIIYNFYNKTSKEMETYEYETFDMSEITSKEELIDVMKEKLEKFEEKYNKLQQDEENMEV